MQIIEAVEFGGPEVLRLREIPDPMPGPGEILVAVAAADTLTLDTELRSGRDIGWDITPPYVPGGGVAGTVVGGDEAVHPLGARVIAFTREGQGGYASHALVPSASAVPVPDDVDDLRVAAALVHDGVTAMGLMETAAISPDEWVLVVGATGGMNALLIQHVRTLGARPIAAVGSGWKLSKALDMGAELAVDYSDPGWTAQISEATGGIGADVVLDGVGGSFGRAAFDEAIADGGRFAVHGTPSEGFTLIEPAEAERRRIAVRGIQEIQYALDERVRLATRALQEAAAGRLRPVIGQTFPLSRAADAHAAIESRSVLGKTLLIP